MWPLCAFMRMKRWCPAFLGLLRKRAAAMPNETCPLKATRPPKRDDGAVPQKSLGSNRASRFSCSSPDFPLRLRHRDGFEALPAPVPRKILELPATYSAFSPDPRSQALRCELVSLASPRNPGSHDQPQSLPRHVSQHS